MCYTIITIRPSATARLHPVLSITATSVRPSFGADQQTTAARSQADRERDYAGRHEKRWPRNDLHDLLVVCCCSDAAVLSDVQPVFERAVQLQLIHSDINRLISGQRYNQSSFRFLSLHRAALRRALSFVSCSCWATDDSAVSVSFSSASSSDIGWQVDGWMAAGRRERD